MQIQIQKKSHVTNFPVPPHEKNMKKLHSEFCVRITNCTPNRIATKTYGKPNENCYTIHKNAFSHANALKSLQFISKLLPETTKKTGNAKKLLKKPYLARLRRALIINVIYF